MHLQFFKEQEIGFLKITTALAYLDVLVAPADFQKGLLA